MHPRGISWLLYLVHWKMNLMPNWIAQLKVLQKLWIWLLLAICQGITISCDLSQLRKREENLILLIHISFKLYLPFSLSLFFIVLVGASHLLLRGGGNILCDENMIGSFVNAAFHVENKITVIINLWYHIIFTTPVMNCVGSPPPSFLFGPLYFAKMAIKMTMFMAICNCSFLTVITGLAGWSVPGICWWGVMLALWNSQRE